MPAAWRVRPSGANFPTRAGHPLAQPTLLRQPAELVRHAADVLDEAGRHVADAVAAQGEGIDEAAEAALDRADDLVVAADRGKEMRDIVGHFPRHLVPFALAHQ